MAEVRKGLVPYLGKRTRFRAVFKRYGRKQGWWPKKTLLLVNVEKDGRVLTDHIWMIEGKRLKLTLVEGDVIEFEARVTTYEKGYRGRRDDGDDLAWENQAVHTDYRLSYPAKVRLVARHPPAYSLYAYMPESVLSTEAET